MSSNEKMREALRKVVALRGNVYESESKDEMQELIDAFFACEKALAEPAELAAHGCKQCPHDVGDAYQRDCVYSDCVQTADPAAQEPVAWRFKERPDDMRSSWLYVSKKKLIPAGQSAQAIYTHPAPEAVRKLPRLTRYETAALELECTDRETGLLDSEKFANTIMDEMEAKAALNEVKGE